MAKKEKIKKTEKVAKKLKLSPVFKAKFKQNISRTMS